jgi:N-acetylmuramoyl-L-alanine amidase
MSSTLSEDGPVVAQPMTRGRHAAARPKHRLRSLGSLARSIQVPVPAPVSRRSEERRTGPAPDRPSGVAQPADTVEVAVQAGDTVGDVAARYGLSTASFIALNGLNWRSTLTEGDRLLVRAPRHAAPSATPVAPERIHHVQAGETLAAVAARHGVGVAALLLANGLSRGAEPLPGTVLTLPVAGRRPTGDALELTGEMLANAEAIAQVARALDVPDDGLVIALVAAMQDSSLRNLDFGEDDAVGLFQQQPSRGWGAAPALLDPRRAALAFFRGGEDGAVGLLATAGWELMPVGEAAHAVQRLSTPAAYAKWERCARAWATRLGRR